MENTTSNTTATSDSKTDVPMIHTTNQNEGLKSDKSANAKGNEGSGKKSNQANKKKKRGNTYKGGKNNNNKKIKNERANVTRKEGGSVDSGTVHLGSFAHPPMQLLFDVTVPDYSHESSLTSPSPTIADKSTNVSSNQDDIANNTSEKNKSIAASPQPSNEETYEKFPKRKIVLFIGFIGKQYSGMQMNKDRDTIQARIELALYKARMIKHSNFGLPNKYSWSNSARTDKGVHSCAQVCSVKAELNTDNMETVRERINEQLPLDIRILDVKRSSRTFCAKTARDKVRYQYMIPSFLLQDHGHVLKLLKEVTKGCEFVNDRNPSDQARHVADGLTDLEVAELRRRFAPYRITKNQLEALSKYLQRFEGTNNFHNYTSGKSFSEASSNRFIISFKVSDTVIDEYGIEWIPTQVMGQSFLLNQIRKMISMAVDTVRGGANEDIFETSFEENKININIAPAQGLFLDMSYYGFHNKRNANNPSSNPSLDWSSDETDLAHQRWKEFKEAQVLPHIMKEEEQEGNFVKYLFQQEYVFGRKNPYLSQPVHNTSLPPDHDQKQSS